MKAHQWLGEIVERALASRMKPLGLTQGENEYFRAKLLGQPTPRERAESSPNRSQFAEAMQKVIDDQVKNGIKACTCGGTVGPDIHGRRMCYQCGPSELRPAFVDTAYGLPLDDPMRGTFEREQRVKTCTCGVTKTGGNHSDWCDLAGE